MISGSRGKPITKPNFKIGNKLFTKSPTFCGGVSVPLAEDNEFPMQWELGRVLEVFTGNDDIIRVCREKTPNSSLIRPVVELRKLAIDSRIISDPSVADKKDTDDYQNPKPFKRVVVLPVLEQVKCLPSEPIENSIELSAVSISLVLFAEDRTALVLGSSDVKSYHMIFQVIISFTILQSLNPL